MYWFDFRHCYLLSSHAPTALVSVRVFFTLDETVNKSPIPFSICEIIPKASEFFSGRLVRRVSVPIGVLVFMLSETGLNFVEKHGS